MAQFDVHRNQGPLCAAIPFVVLVQSAQFDGYRRRVLIPLVRRSAMPEDAPPVGTRLNPVLTVQGVDVVLHPLDLVSAPLDQIGPYVGSLADQRQRIVDALDQLLTRSCEWPCAAHRPWPLTCIENHAVGTARCGTCAKNLIFYTRDV